MEWKTFDKKLYDDIYVLWIYILLKAAFVNKGIPILGPRLPIQALHNCPGFLCVFRTGHFFEMGSPGVTLSFLDFLEHFSCLGDPRVSVRPHISSESIEFLYKDL